MVMQQTKFAYSHFTSLKPFPRVQARVEAMPPDVRVIRYYTLSPEEITGQQNKNRSKGMILTVQYLTFFNEGNK